MDPRRKLDCYIDNTIGVTVDLPGTDNAIRMERAALLAIHTTSRPIEHPEPIPCDEMAAANKLSAEGGLEEQKTILGWVFDLHRLTIALPYNKFIAWSDTINEMLQKGSMNSQELEQLIG